MNIGSLYTVKKYYWLLFPTKETAAAQITHAADVADAVAAAAAARWCVRLGHAAAASPVAPTAAAAVSYADYWSRKYNCEVTYFSPESFIVFLEKDKKLNRVLTGDGRIGWIGWIWFNEDYISCFEEISNE